MNILVPLNDLEHLENFILAGAREFYIGFYDTAWTEKYGTYADLNRLSGFLENANRYTFEEVLDIIKNVKEKAKMLQSFEPLEDSVSIYITFNASTYSKEQYEDIRNYFRRLKSANVTGVIVSNLELVMLAKEEQLEAVVSTIAGVYNSDTVKVYQTFGAKRVILPRDLNMEEIKSIVTEVPNVEYEVFMMRNGCMFSDSNCLGLHRCELSSICATLTHADATLRMKDDSFCHMHDAELNQYLYHHSFHEYTCGLCSIFRFVKMNIAACKIVGRSEDWEAICEDVKVVKENIDLAKECQLEEDYLTRMKFPKHRKIMCKLGLSCYYPEIRF